MSDSACATCTELRSRLDAALAERDEALLDLARAREELNRRRLAERWADEEDIPLYPLAAGAALPVPLRYRAVDALDRWAKAVLPGPARDRLRALVQRAHGREQ